MTKRTPHPCAVCGRRAGSVGVDVAGAPDGSVTPLGRVTRCPDCHQWACPDCLHDRNCCDGLAEDAATDALPDIVPTDGTIFCARCHGSIDERDEPAACAECGRAFHAVCLSVGTRCSACVDADSKSKGTLFGEEAL